MDTSLDLEVGERSDGKSRGNALTVGLVLGDRQMCPAVSF